MQLTGAQILTRVLMEQEVDTIFGYPGGAVLNIYDELYHCRNKIRHIMTAHEQGASHAADGYARATGKTGVVLATSGPGATNLVTGIATAYMDSVPMVCITGNVSTDLIGRDSFQEVFITGITMPITKHNYVVRRVEDLADTLRDAFRIAISGRKGPVLVDIPKDVTANKCEYIAKDKIVVEHESYVDEQSLTKAAQLINNSRRPVIYFGGGVSASKACTGLRELSSKAEIPACHTIMGTGILGSNDPLDLGMIGMHGCVTSNYAIDNCDLLIAIGVRFSDRVAGNPKKFAPKADIIHIDIDPSEINKNVMVDVPLVGDIGKVLAKLNPLIEHNEHPDWMRKIEKWRKEDYHPIDNDNILRPHQVIKAIADIAGDDAIFVTDVGQHQMWAAQYCNRTKPRSFITSGGLGTMGFGYGAAIGAKIAYPNRPVIHVTGDGSFHMNLNECCTAVSYDIPVITVIMNNTVLGMVRQWQHYFYGDRYSSTSPERQTDFVALAKAFGADGVRCTNLAEFKEALTAALAANKPMWIDCQIDKDEMVMPMIPAGKTIESMIVEY